jgi:hypothetical protein
MERLLGAEAHAMYLIPMSIVVEGILGILLLVDQLFILRSLRRLVQLLIAMHMMIQLVSSPALEQTISLLSVLTGL